MLFSPGGDDSSSYPGDEGTWVSQLASGTSRVASLIILFHHMHQNQSSCMLRSFILVVGSLTGPPPRRPFIPRDTQHHTTRGGVRMGLDHLHAHAMGAWPICMTAVLAYCLSVVGDRWCMHHRRTQTIPGDRGRHRLLARARRLAGGFPFSFLWQEMTMGDRRLLDLLETFPWL